MRDSFGREITYMRVSVTDLCNLRCCYCMPAEGVIKKQHSEMMTEDETIQAIEAASELGIKKIRITGGEPLVKKNIISICRRAAAVPGIEEVALTTNGTLLSELARPLCDTGIRRLNISLDTLNPEKYAAITRGGSLNDALRGVDAARSAGFRLKLNAVMLRGFNDDEIPRLADITRKWNVDMRFIELMPMPDTSGFIRNSLMTTGEAIQLLPGLDPLPVDGVARMYQFRGVPGRVGFISPMSDAFCSRCNRIRITADGHLKPCLHSAFEISVKGMDKSGMKEAIRQAVLAKPEKHTIPLFGRSEAGRCMNRIGG